MNKCECIEFMMIRDNKNIITVLVFDVSFEYVVVSQHKSLIFVYHWQKNKI